MTPQEAYRQLRPRVEALANLNPDLSVTQIETMYRLADQASSERFDELESIAEGLIEAYVNSPPKRVTAHILREYFHHLDTSALLLSEKAGQTPAPETEPETEPESSAEHSVSLVARQVYTPLEWCKVVTNAPIPHPLIKAVEACRRRNELVQTVLVHLFKIMQQVDIDKTVQWQLRYLDERRGNLDADVVRDMINGWLGRDDLPREILAWAEEWSADSNLMQQWPHVVRRADRLLCLNALKKWLESASIRNSALAHLRLLLRQNRTSDKTLLNWLKGVLVDIGESVLRFVSLSRLESSSEEGASEWRSAAIVREILRLEALFTPTLLVADLILAVPDGANQFAVAFFGLVGKGRKQWEDRLNEIARKAVRQTFLQGIREGVSPVEIIRHLTFGDEQAFLKTIAELDMVTVNFDSVKQREKVVHFLAVYYASYRENELLADEVTRRYRSLMRLMHEDHLRRVLTEDHLRDVIDKTILRDLSTMASEARQFLTRRRALDSTLEELVAAELEFIQGVRTRRLRLIHRLLG